MRQRTVDPAHLVAARSLAWFTVPVRGRLGLPCRYAVRMARPRFGRRTRKAAKGCARTVIGWHLQMRPPAKLTLLCKGLQARVRLCLSKRLQNQGAGLERD